MSAYLTESHKVPSSMVMATLNPSLISRLTNAEFLNEVGGGKKAAGLSWRLAESWCCVLAAGDTEDQSTLIQKHLTFLSVSPLGFGEKVWKCV